MAAPQVSPNPMTVKRSNRASDKFSNPEGSYRSAAEELLMGGWITHRELSLESPLSLGDNQGKIPAFVHTYCCCSGLNVGLKTHIPKAGGVAQHENLCRGSVSHLLKLSH